MEQIIPGKFPHTRMRRMRRFPWTRKLGCETTLSAENLIWPVFVHDGDDEVQQISSMPGVSRYSLRGIAAEVKKAYELGIPAVAVFPHIAKGKKNNSGDEAVNPKNIVCRAVSEIKEMVPEIGVICDVALDPFTDHGHDGVVVNGVVDNDKTVAILCEQALVQAKAGCDVIAPSDMMDGRVGQVRAALDSAGLLDKMILSYAAKYASAFYGPYRDAVGSDTLIGADKALGFRDKRGYQMNPANRNEALREVAQDLEEGADMVMVKPGLPYLDIIRDVKDAFGVPTAAYQVSGEYSMLCAAFEKGYLDRNRCVLESLLCFRRAGADMIISYFAREAAAAL